MTIQGGSIPQTSTNRMFSERGMVCFKHLQAFNIYIYIHNTHIHIYFIIIFYSIPPKYPKIINTQHLCHKSLDHVSPSEERKPALRSPTDPNRISGARYQTVTTSVTPVTCCFNMFELCKNMDPPVDLD